MCKLAYGRRLADTVDADYKDDRRTGVQAERRIAYIQHIHKDVLQRSADFFRVAQLFFPDALAELLDRLAGGLHAHIGEDHTLLQFLIKLVVCA